MTKAPQSEVLLVFITYYISIVIKEKPRTVKKLCRFVLTTLALLTFLPRLVFAYLDPGSGSMLLQILLGGVVGLIVIIKLYWNAILTLLHIRKAAPKESEVEANEVPPTNE